MHVNCLSSPLTIQRVAPEMRKAGGGSIINVSSVGGLVALPSVTAAVIPVEAGHTAW